jgi:hypothetical protein
MQKTYQTPVIDIVYLAFEELPYQSDAQVYQIVRFACGMGKRPLLRPSLRWNAYCVKREESRVTVALLSCCPGEDPVIKATISLVPAPDFSRVLS